MKQNEKLRCMTSVYLTRDNQMLLLYRQGGRVVSDVWVGSAGGHFEKDELNNPEACVLRELQEELGITPDDVEGLTMRYITMRRTNDEIRQNYYFFAELKEQALRGLSSNEGTLKWFDFSEVSALEMPLSAKQMMGHYLTEGIHTDKKYVGITGNGQATFVELQET